jgi:tetratricopeptide (TPR) repeat protein
LEYEKGENYAAAEAYLRKALAINPGFVPTYTMLALILSLQEATRPEALKIARAAVNLEPAEPRHFLNVCQVLMAMENYDEAIRWAERALALASTDADTYNAESMLSRIAGERERKRQEKADKENFTRQARQMEQRQSEAAEMKKQLAPDIKKGPPGKVIGVIKSVQCGYPAIMDILLDSDGKQQKFRAENYYKIDYEAIGGPGRTEFEPCEELQGKRVEIDFLSVSDREFSGIINKVGIVK